MENLHCEGEPAKKRRRWFVPNWYLLILALVLILLLIVLISVIMTLNIPDKELPLLPDRIACPGIKNASECKRRLCIYSKTRTTIEPSCFMAKDAFGYRVVNVTPEEDGPAIALQRMTLETPYGFSFEDVTFKVTYLTENILRFQFKNANEKRYEVPAQDVFPLLQNASRTVDPANLTYRFLHTNHSKVFHFKIKRKDDGTTLWDTRLGALLLTDQYLQIGSYLPSNNVYGLGEHVHDTIKRITWYKSWPMFAADKAPKVPADQTNLYGVHPFYTCVEKSGKSHGVLFLNSNAMDVTLMPAPAISFRTIGGILDFFVFVGDNPEHVVQLYTSVIGRPMIPPYWSLGFQLSRYGYNRIQDVQEVIGRMNEKEIPHAVQYLDIDHLADSKDFTYNNKTFKGLPELIEKTRSETNLKWIVIVDPGMAADLDYEPYVTGLNQSVYVKRAAFWNPDMFPEELEEHNVTYGQVWPRSRVAFPDFFLNSTKQWWKEELLKYRNTIKWDGLWIDMNEPANFATDSEGSGFCVFDRTENPDCKGMTCPTSKYEDPPYSPVSDQLGLSSKTLCMESVQGDDQTVFYKHYNVHSLYGWSQTLPTLQAAQEATGTRSLVISRSTYPSSGQYAGHWLGDNFSSYEDMKRSIIGMLEFNMFGIPYVGADVCGFYGSSDSDLCMRWMQLGAFYPYFRNHNGLGNPKQDPAAFEDRVATASRKAIERRIGLNPYLYTLFYRAHVDGSTVVRPLFHEYPLVNLALAMSTQFMWGRSLLVAPILERNRNYTAVYLPKDEWWLFMEEKSMYKQYTEWYRMERSADEYTPLYVRGGTVLPYEKYDKQTYNTSADYRNISLYIFPTDGQASGELFMDDGVSKDSVENNAYAVYDFQYVNCSLKIVSQENANFKGVNPVLLEVIVFKVKSISSAGSYSVSEVDKKHDSVVIKVGTNMNQVNEITWQDTDGNCTMFP